MAKKIRLTDHSSLNEGLPKHNIRKKINHEKIEKIEKAIEGETSVAKKTSPEPTTAIEQKVSNIETTKVEAKKTIPLENKETPIVTKKQEVTKVNKPVVEKKTEAKPKRGRGRPKAEEEGQLTTLRFPSELYIELKIKAFREKKTFRELVMEGLKHYLNHKKK